MFADRHDAGRRLAAALSPYRGEDAVVLALPRGGVPVGAEVAKALGVPLDVVLVRKLGVPWQPELALGAIGEQGVRVLNPEVVSLAHISDAELAELTEREQVELSRRAERYRGGRGPVDVAGRLAIVVDDGLATGATARAACQVVRSFGAAKVVLAVPVGPDDTVRELESVADEVVCVEVEPIFFAIGEFYDDFGQLTDENVLAELTGAT